MLTGVDGVSSNQDERGFRDPLEGRYGDNPFRHHEVERGELIHLPDGSAMEYAYFMVPLPLQKPARKGDIGLGGS